jgi:hypothetical protein
MSRTAVAAREFDHFRIDGRKFPFTNPGEVSGAYRATIDALALGASETPSCEIFDSSGRVSGYVSYNGKVWRGDQRDWQPGKEPLFNPYAIAAGAAA